MIIDKSFKVAVAFTITNADGTPFFANHTEWEAMDYEGVVLIERKMTNVLNELVVFGEEKLAAAMAARAGAPSA